MFSRNLNGGSHVDCEISTGWLPDWRVDLMKPKKETVALLSLGLGLFALVYGLITKAMLSHRYTFKAPLTSMELSVLAIIGIGFVLLIVGALLFISVRYTSKNVVDIDSTRNKGKVCPYCQTRIIGDAKHCPNCGQELGQ